MLTWFQIALGAMKLATAFVELLRDQKLISDAEKALAYDVVSNIEKRADEADKARRDQQQRDGDPRSLRDDDGYRRD